MTSELRPGVAVHTISLRGYAGGIFVVLVVAAVFYSIGFATPNWSVNGDLHQGLWEKCHCELHEQHEDWFIAFKVLICVGLGGLCICLLLACLYMCVHEVSKNSTIKALIAFCFLSVLVMLAGFILYGIKMSHLNWSFVLSVLGCFFTLIAGVFSIVQMKNSGVRV